MTYNDEDLIQLSALTQYIYCHRRCALIHIEQVWIENYFTAEGRQMHETAHEEKIENRKDIRTERGIPLRSTFLGLSGKADVIEYHKNEKKKWLPFPVEYKRGKPKMDDCDRVQVCAQALCLEEMLKISISKGALYYGKTKHRYDVVFDDVLREKTIQVIREVRAFIETKITPKPEYSKKCESCSLLEICMPKSLEKTKRIIDYIEKEINIL